MKLTGYSVLFLILSLLGGCIESSREAPLGFESEYGDTVVLYSTRWCEYCEKTRQVLDNNYIEYIEYDIESSEQGRIEFDKLEGKGIPMVLVKGRVVDGYAPNAVLQLVRGI